MDNDRVPVSGIVANDVHSGELSPPPPPPAGSVDSSGPPLLASEQSPRAVAPGADTDGTTTRPKFRLGNRPPLTGFRAFALTTVLVYHSNFKTWPGSWIAIQMFFVLSGFLITAMLAYRRRQEWPRQPERVLFAAGRSVAAPTGAHHRAPCHLRVICPRARCVAAVVGRQRGGVSLLRRLSKALGPLDRSSGIWHRRGPFPLEEQFYIIWSVLMVTAVALHRRRTGLRVRHRWAGIEPNADRLWQVYQLPRTSLQLFFAALDDAFDTRSDAIFVGCLLGLLGHRRIPESMAPTVRTNTVCRSRGVGGLFDLDPVQCSLVSAATRRVVDTR